MEKALEVSNEQKMENISNEDWPLLKELETTRFSLKNKKNVNSNNPLEKLKELSEKEDELLSMQNIEDEKLVEEFIESSKNQNSNNQSNNTYNNMNQAIAQNNHVETNIQSQQANQNKAVQNQVNQNQDMASLVAKGMAKVYMEKTDTILSPLEFLIKNFKNILVGLIQFIIPAVITWLVLTKVSFVSNIMAKETTNMQYFYSTVFYFACLFISITIQVTISGMVNIFGIAFKNLANEAKTK